MTIETRFIKTIFTVALFVGVAVQTAKAQSPWSASVGAQFSLSELKSDDNARAGSEVGPGGALNLGVGYALNGNWSIHSGVGIGYLRNNTGLKNYSGSQDAVDIEGTAFEFRYTVTNYFENQSYTTASIPLAVQYESNGTTRFYARAGASYTLFFNSEADGKASNITTTGFFDQLNAELDRPRFAGFGSFNNVDFAKQDIEIKNSINATLEFGVKQRLAEGRWMYIGLFFERGLNDLLDTTGGSLIQYNNANPTGFSVNPTLSATDQATGNTFVENTKLRSFGFKLWYSFDF